MQKLIIFLLVGSILVNIIAIWGFFHYIKYGGSPLGELKRRLTGTVKQRVPAVSIAEENAKLMTYSDSLRVVFFGASITRRWDLEKAFPMVHMVNRGVGGQFVPDMLFRFKRDVIDLKPKAAIIKFCSINIRPQISPSNLRDAMTMMVRMAQANGITPIMTTIIPAGKPEAHIGDFSVVDTLAGFNNWARQYARENNIALIDFAAAIADENGFLPRDYSTDPVHVNEKGYEILAAAARPVIEEVVLGVKTQGSVN